MEDLKQKIRNPSKGNMGRVETEEAGREEMLFNQSEVKEREVKGEGLQRMKELEAIWSERDNEITKMD